MKDGVCVCACVCVCVCVCVTHLNPSSGIIWSIFLSRRSRSISMTCVTHTHTHDTRLYPSMPPSHACSLPRCFTHACTSVHLSLPLPPRVYEFYCACVRACVCVTHLVVQLIKLIKQGLHTVHVIACILQLPADGCLTGLDL